jgi:hypothetical protein
MLEKIGKMQNEQIPALIATIRDQIGIEQAEQFKTSIKPVLDNLYSAVTTGHDTADQAVQALAGEQVSPGDMAMGMGGDEMGADLGAAPDLGADTGVPPAEPQSDLDVEDGFDATDAAAGGSADLGRTRR